MRTFSIILILSLLLPACDSFRPKKTFRLAIPENDHSYNISSQHLVSFLEDGGFNVKFISAENAIEANRLVAQGKAAFELSKYIYQHRLDLMKYDLMYRSIKEVFDVSELLYPLHEGSNDYLRRHQPSFAERHADIPALATGNKQSQGLA